jgi:mRNA interferase RelE/StbE
MTKRYTLRYHRHARRYLARLDSRERSRIMEAISSLADPSRKRELDVRKLRNRPEHRLRVGNHRVLFLVIEEDSVILVRAIRMRGQAYRR